MEQEWLEGRIGTISQRISSLLNQVWDHPAPPTDLLTETLEELNVTLEELQVAQEELHQRNDLLATACQLLESEQQRYLELFEFAPDGYLVTDHQGKILAANRTAAALLNLPQKYLLHKVMAMFVAKTDRRAFRRDLLQLPQVDCVSERFMQLQPRDQPPFEAALTVTSIRTTSGQISGWRWLIRDITERRQLEEARIRAQLSEMTNQRLEQEILRRQQLEIQLRQQAAALEQANHLKDEFLAIVSHELRSPLTAILGWAQLLISQDLDRKTTARALAVIERNATAQCELLADLLDMAQIARGDLNLTMGLVDLSSVVRAAVETLQPEARAKQIQLHVMLGAQASFISGDAARLQQIMLNLISNAIKFTPCQGQVWVRLERTAAEMVITIRDTGQGIAPEFLPHLFERFRQAEPSGTRLHGGLGLGLAIVRQLVQLHGGYVQADSPGLNQGSTFTVTLPRMAVRPSEVGKTLFQPASAIRLDQVRVLLVEDQADVRELLTLALEQAGASVTAVGSVAEALNVLELAIPDVLISDIGMPEADGYQLMQAVRAMPQTALLPAIALTALTNPADQTQILASGFQVHLPKPVDPAQLVAVVASQVQA